MRKKGASGHKPSASSKATSRISSEGKVAKKAAKFLSKKKKDVHIFDGAIDALTSGGTMGAKKATKSLSKKKKI